MSYLFLSCTERKSINRANLLNLPNLNGYLPNLLKNDSFKMTQKKSGATSRFFSIKDFVDRKELTYPKQFLQAQVYRIGRNVTNLLPRPILYF